jgi:hypothetical protein
LVNSNSLALIKFNNNHNNIWDDLGILDSPPASFERGLTTSAMSENLTTIVGLGIGVKGTKQRCSFAFDRPIGRLIFIEE